MKKINHCYFHIFASRGLLVDLNATNDPIESTLPVSNEYIRLWHAEAISLARCGPENAREGLVRISRRWEIRRAEGARKEARYRGHVSDCIYLGCFHSWIMSAFSFVTTCLARACISADVHYRPRLSLLTNDPPSSTLPSDIYQRALQFLRAEITHEKRRINLVLLRRGWKSREQSDGQWLAAKIISRWSFREIYATKVGRARSGDGDRGGRGAQLTNYYSIREIELPPPFTESTIFAVDCLSPITGT